MMDATGPGGWVLLAVTIAGFIFQYIREGRQRRWDKEDRATLAQKVERTGEVLNSKLAENTALTIENTAHAIEAKYEARAAFQESKAALSEANQINMKLKEIGLQVIDGQIKLMSQK